MSRVRCLSRSAWQVGWLRLTGALLLGAWLLFSFTLPQTARAATTFHIDICDAAHLDAALAQAQANSGNTIAFRCRGSIALDQTLIITTTLTIDGSGQSVTLNGQGTRRDFLVQSRANLTLKVLTITGGSAQSGGGPLNQGGKVTLINCIVTGNSATSGGGGLGNENGTMTLINCTVAHNKVTSDGGGLFNSGGSTMTLTKSTATENTAGGNGGLGNLGKVTLTNSTIVQNAASFNGGGLINTTNGTMSLTNTTVARNSAGSGGGLFNSGKTVSSSGSIVAENTASTGSNCQNQGTLTDRGFNLEGGLHWHW